MLIIAQDLLVYDYVTQESFIESLDKLIDILDVENDVFAILRNKKNQIAMLHSSSTQWKHTFSLEISLEKGYVNLYGILSSTRSYGQGERLVTARKQFENVSFALGNPQENLTYFSQDKSWEREIGDFVDCIKNDKKITVGSSKDALKTMELVYKIYSADSKWFNKMKSYERGLIYETSCYAR